MNLQDKNLYYVGGVVRDELLGISSNDTDFCYEGNAIEFVRGMNIIKTNPALGTVKILYFDNEIDIASTRTETYPKKGHLPHIVKIGCPLKEDLIRRDFTINAMAKRTTNGEIIDCFGGQKDIDNRVLRVLHDNSFIDDPTRIIRGLKFSARFGFELEEKTKKLQDTYLNNINYDMSSFRLKKELKDTFNLNKHEIYLKFINQGMYKLLGENQQIPDINPLLIEKYIQEYPSDHTWLVYLGYFNLSKFELTKAERKILEWAEKLKTQSRTNNTPLESIIMHNVWKDEYEHL